MPTPTCCLHPATRCEQVEASQRVQRLHLDLSKTDMMQASTACQAQCAGRAVRAASLCDASCRSQQICLWLWACLRNAGRQGAQVHERGARLQVRCIMLRRQEQDEQAPVVFL